MKKIEFTKAVIIGGKQIDSIEVAPLYFLELVKTWGKAERAAGVKPEAAIQRERIRHQVHFLSAGERVKPEDSDILQIPLEVIRPILDAVDEGQGRIGKLLNEGDGVTEAVLYQLGTPIELKSGKDGAASIKELEFKAATYGDLEDVLSAGSDSQKAIELLRTVASPVEIEGLMRLPGWALDKLTVADGIGVMQLVLPRF